MKVINLQRNHLAVGWMPAVLPTADRPAANLLQNDDGLTATFILKVAFRLVDGGPAEIWPDDPPALRGDVPIDGNPALGISYASDWVPSKPRAEWLATGTAHPPAAAGSRFEATIRVGQLAKTIAVVGERRWQSRLWGTRAGPAGIAGPVPIRPDQAWGGPDSGENPAGLGLADDRLPRLETAGAEINAPGSHHRPAWFGPIAAGWSPRGELLRAPGTAWTETRWPWLPESFDCRFFLAAAADQWCDGFFRGDEEIVLEHLRPDVPRLRSWLPGRMPRCLVLREGAGHELTEVPLQLDTIWIDADTLKTVCLWRGRCGVASVKLRDLSALVVDLPAAGEQRRLDDYAAHLPPAAVGVPPTPARRDPAAIRAEMKAQMKAEMEAEMAAFKQEMAEVRQQAEAQLGDRFSRLAEQVVIKAPPQGSLQEGPLKAFEPLRSYADRMLIRLAKAVPPQHRDRLTSVKAAVADGFASLAALPGKIPEIEATVAAKMPAKPGQHELVACGRAGRLVRANLRGRDFSGLDLAGCSFEQAQLSGAVFRGARLCGCNLRGANLVRADLTGADLSNAILDRADLSESLVTGVQWNGCQIAGTRLVGLALEGAVFTGVVGRWADFSRARLEGACFVQSRLPAVFFRDANLAGASFQETDLSGGFFDSAVLPRAAFIDCTARKAKFRFAADACGLVFHRTAAERSSWETAVLRGAEFLQADLTGASFAESLADGASFDRCTLVEAAFDDASLVAANLTHANLLRCGFERADLSRARLDGSNAYEAGFWNSRLEGVSLIDTEVGRTLLEWREATDHAEDDSA
jgi:uncharacterized protein YjbI with pentapeptide repeats